MKAEVRRAFKIYTQNEELARALMLLLRKISLPSEVLPAYTGERESPSLFDLDTVPLPVPPPDTLLAIGEKPRPEAPFPYLPRPFLSEVLLSLCKEMSKKRPHGSFFSLAEAGKSIFRNGERLSLSKTEYALFLPLFHHIGEEVSKEALADAAGIEDKKSLPVYMYHLRKKLESDGGRYLVAVRSRGYLLKAP